MERRRETRSSHSRCPNGVDTERILWRSLGPNPAGSPWKSGAVAGRTQIASRKEIGEDDGGARPAQRSYDSSAMASRRKRIIDTAHEIIARKGTSGLTIRGLASAAEVAPRTIYRLFGDKESVISATVSERMNEVREDIAKLGRKYSLEEVFTELDWMVSEMERDTEYARVVVGFFFSMEPRRPEIRELRSVALARFRHWMHREEEVGKLREGVDHDLVSRAHVAQEFIVYRRFLLGLASNELCKLELRAAFLQSAIIVLDGARQDEYFEMLSAIQKEIRRITTSPPRDSEVPRTVKIGSARI